MIDSNHRELARLESQLIEQEHRAIRLFLNFVYRKRRFKDTEMRAAAVRALLYWFVPSPQTVAIASGGVLTGLLLFWQNVEIRAQTELAKEANNRSKVNAQIDQRQEEKYLALKSEANRIAENATTRISENNAQIVTLKEKERIHRATSRITDLLQHADKLACRAESNPLDPHSHSYRMALESASQEAEGVSVYLSPAIYLSLADLGRSFWPFERVKRYCEVAINKSRSPYQKQLCFQMMACLYYSSEEETPDAINGSKYFSKSLEILQGDSDAYRRANRIGELFSLWSAYERYCGNFTRSEELAQSAGNEWNVLGPSTRREKEKELMSTLVDAENGIQPRSPCREFREENEFAPVEPYFLDVPPFSRDKRLGRVIDGQLYMEYVVVERAKVLVQSDGGVRSDSSYVVKTRLLIVKDPDLDLPWNRYQTYSGAKFESSEIVAYPPSLASIAPPPADPVELDIDAGILD